MEDLTTCDPDIRGRDEGFDAPSLDRLLNQEVERYVPSCVCCSWCGCSGEEFSWFQRIRCEEAAEYGIDKDLYFCSVLCLGYFSTENLPGYYPKTLPVNGY